MRFLQVLTRLYNLPYAKFTFMRDWNELKKNLKIIEEKLGLRFKDPNKLALAFVHRSYVNEDKSVLDHNERLEFLGDSVLGLIVAEYLFLLFPNTAEGDLSFYRSRLVEASSCVKYMQSLNVSDYLLLGKGERLNDGRGRDSILADLFEAIIGAIFLDQGFEFTKAFFFKHFQEHVSDTLKTPIRNWKALFQDFCQKKYQKPPVYRVVEETGPDHSKQFTVAVLIEDLEVGRGSGLSKKEAQQQAAAHAFAKVNPKNL